MGNLTSILNGISKSFYNNFIVVDRYMHIVDGLKTTLIITVFAVLLGTLLGGETPLRADLGVIAGR